MRKLLPVEAKRVVAGLYIADLCQPWWNHSFLLPQFRLEQGRDLDALHKMGDHQVIVDTGRSDPGAVSRLFGNATLALDETCRMPSHTPCTPAPIQRPASNKELSTSKLEDELRLAKALVARAKQALMDVMADVRAGKLVRLAPAEELARGMVQSMGRNQGALLSLAALKTKDDYTFSHCVAVAAMMVAFGRRLKLPETALQDVCTAGLLHDVGKAGIPLEILNKPGKLTAGEFDIIKSHPQIGHDILKIAGFPDSPALDVVLHHHERLDGKGYPSGIAGDELSLYARMGAICDVYDAVTSNRCYHQAMHPTAALKLLSQNAGAQFDKSLVAAFIQTLGIYPNQSVVKLKSEKLAVVIEQVEGDALKPKVRVFYSCKSGMRVNPYDLCLTQTSDSIAEPVNLSAYGLPENTGAVVAGLLDR